MEFTTFWDIVRQLEGKTVQTVNAYDASSDDYDGIVVTCTDGTKLVVAVDMEDSSDGLMAWDFGKYERDKEG